MNKKTMIITISSVVAVLLIIGIIWFVIAQNNQYQAGKAQSKVAKLFTTLTEGQGGYTFTREKDKDNQITNMRKGDKAYKEEIVDGGVLTYLVVEGDTYLLQNDTKTYYRYQNNDMILGEITNNLEKIKDSDFSTGKETIDKKEYTYEEFSGYQEFLMDTNLTTSDSSKAKTRFYFKGNTLTYIKTIVGDQEELIKVTVTNQAEDSKLQLPQDYRNGEEL